MKNKNLFSAVIVEILMMMPNLAYSQFGNVDKRVEGF